MGNRSVPKSFHEEPYTRFKVVNDCEGGRGHCRSGFCGGSEPVFRLAPDPLGQGVTLPLRPPASGTRSQLPPGPLPLRLPRQIGLLPPPRRCCRHPDAPWRGFTAGVLRPRPRSLLGGLPPLNRGAWWAGAHQDIAGGPGGRSPCCKGPPRVEAPTSHPSRRSLPGAAAHEDRGIEAQCAVRDLGSRPIDLIKVYQNL